MSIDKDLDKAAQAKYGKNYDDLFPAQQGELLLEKGKKLAEYGNKLLGNK